MTERNQIQPRRAYLCEAGVTLKFKMEENDPLDEIVHRLSQLPTSLRVLFQEATGTRYVDPSSIASHVTDLLTATLMRPQMPQLEPTWRFLESAQNIRDIRALLHPDRCLSAVAALVTTTFLLDQMTRPIETTVYGAEQRHLVAQKYWGVLFHNLKEKFRAQEPEFSCLPVVRTQKTKLTLKSQLEQFRIFEPKNDAELEQFIRTLYRLADFRHSQLYQYMHGGMEETRQDEMEKMFQFLEPDNDFLKRVPLLYFKERFDNLGYDKRHNLLMHVILILQEEGTLEQHIERFVYDFEQSEDLMLMFWSYYIVDHQNPLTTDGTCLSAPQVLLQTCMEKNPDRYGEFLSRVLKLPSEHGKELDGSKLLKPLFVDLCAAKAKGLVTPSFITIYRAMIEHFSGGKNILRATDILEEKRPGAVFWTGSNILVLSSLEQKELSALVQRQIKKGYPLLTSFGVL